VIRTDVEKMLLADETPVANAVEQCLIVDVNDGTGLDSAHLDAISERACNQADLIDQAIIVGVSEPMWQPDITPARPRGTRRGGVGGGQPAA
jgi:hypothetical protein